MATQEQRWAAAERSLDGDVARRIRRTPATVIAVLGTLVIAVGLTAVVDLRRLHTPQGAALAWLEAATFGDCRAFLALSRPADPLAERRAPGEICGSLRVATARARTDEARIALRPRAAVQRGSEANVTIEVRAPAGTRSVSVHLVQRRGSWLVVRPTGACGAVACY